MRMGRGSEKSPRTKRQLSGVLPGDQFVHFRQREQQVCRHDGGVLTKGLPQKPPNMSLPVFNLSWIYVVYVYGYGYIHILYALRYVYTNV